MWPWISRNVIKAIEWTAPVDSEYFNFDFNGQGWEISPWGHLLITELAKLLPLAPGNIRLGLVKIFSSSPDKAKYEYKRVAFWPAIYLPHLENYDLSREPKRPKDLAGQVHCATFHLAKSARVPRKWRPWAITTSASLFRLNGCVGDAVGRLAGWTVVPVLILLTGFSGQLGIRTCGKTSSELAKWN